MLGFSQFSRGGRDRDRDVRDSRALHNVSVRLLGVAVAVATLAQAERPADACGACFHKPQERESTVVTDHRMAFSVSKLRTVLWDQIQYQGNPSDFVWALPVRQGTVVQLSRDAWMSALDAVSQPVILSPPDYGSGGGCGIGCASSATSGFNDSASTPGQQVTVVSQSVVGPYETVTLRSTNPTALADWLTGHGYALPDAMRPVVAAYVSEGFDFIALRLQPGFGVGAMQPVRIVTPGADLSLPLRMVAGGVGANVGITLFVLAEGRYEPQNFPVATFDDRKLVWDYGTQSSNYQALSLSIMGQNGGRTFLTEYSDRQPITPTPGYASNLATLYYQQCENSFGSGGYDAGPIDGYDGGAIVTQDDAGVGAQDASADGGVSDANTSDADTSDADTDASDPDAATADAGKGDASSGFGDDASLPAPQGTAGACDAFDDLRLATEGMDSASVTLTRLRAFLPVSALAQDLKLQASASQGIVSNEHTATATGSSNQASVSPIQSQNAGSWVIAGATALTVLRTLRRKKRKDG